MGVVDFLVGRSVVELRYRGAPQLRLVFEHGTAPAPNLYVDLSGVFAYTTTHGEVSIDPEIPTTLGHVLPIAGATLSEAAVGEDGTLRLSFDDRRLIECSPDPDYQAWQVSGGAPEWLVVCIARRRARRLG